MIFVCVGLFLLSAATVIWWPRRGPQGVRLAAFICLVVCGTIALRSEDGRSLLGCLLFMGLGAVLSVCWSMLAVRVHSGWSVPSGEASMRDVPPPPTEVGMPLPFPARVRTGTRYGADGVETYTEFSCEAQRGTLRLIVTSPEWAGRTFLLPSMAPLDVGAWPYVVLTNEAATATSLLDFETRRAIEAVDVIHLGPLLVDLRPGVLIIRASGVRGEAATEQFAHRAAEVARRIRGMFDERDAVVRPEGVCRVCGVTLQGLIATCAACRTPHHRECWTYNGGCSVYACGGRVAA